MRFFLEPGRESLLTAGGGGLAVVKRLSAGTRDCLLQTVTLGIILHGYKIPPRSSQKLDFERRALSTIVSPIFGYVLIFRTL